MTKQTRLTYKQQKELIDLKHKNMMDELEYERESAKRYHDMAMERMRIKSAEIRKAQMRKEAWKK
jgi:hypothetical protein